MRAVLGIDAAWTSAAPSGVALCVEATRAWRCVAVAPSYDDFVTLADGHPMDWSRPRIHGGDPDPERLVRAARRLAPGAHLAAIAIDIPLARGPITGRRFADQEISRMFGARHCSTHSPSPSRPGRLATILRDGFGALGFELATTLPARTPAVFEVYPHPALLSLLVAPERVPYKVAKAGKYWPGRAAEDRRREILRRWQDILSALRRSIELDLVVPMEFASAARMKRYEDAIDALVCAWVATRFLSGAVVPYGDPDAAIWIPT